MMIRHLDDSTQETGYRDQGVDVIADLARGALVGAWAVAPLAGDGIHYAALAIKTRTPLAVLRDSVTQFPTFTEAYLKRFEQL